MAAPDLSTTPVATITAAGISAPSFDYVLSWWQAKYQSIYGADANLDPNTPDGQWVAALAMAQNDFNSACIATYNSFSPATAQGNGLSSVVKINGLRRQVSSNSTVPCELVGSVTTVTNGIVTDSNGNQWALPATVNIPDSGSITVTATCLALGAITASAGAVQITTPTRGWQSASFTSAATPGAPVEADAALRQRQANSTALPAQTPLESIVAAVLNVSGVQQVQPYENDTSTTNGLGIPPHSIALVVLGGDATAIATAIASKKLGAGTYGSISETIIDQNGVPDVIHFSTPTTLRIVASLTVTPLTGFVSTTETAIANAMSAWVQGGQVLSAAGQPIVDPAGNPISYPGLSIGDASGVALNDLIAAAKLPAPLGQTYKIEYGALTIAQFGGSLGTSDISLAYNQNAGLAVSDVTITVA